MIYYVYLEPEIVRDAVQAGSLGISVLQNILTGFTQNCLVIDYEDWSVHGRLGEEVRQLADVNDRKRLQAILKKLHHNFVFELQPDYTGAKDLFTCALEQLPTLEADLMLVIAARGPIATDIEVTTLHDYAATDFEQQRQRSVKGRSFAAGALDRYDFMDAVFNKALRFSHRIDIYDKIFGSQFGSNFEYTAEHFLRWLRGKLTHPAECKIVFHCEMPPGQMPQHIKKRLSEFRNAAGLHDVDIEIQYYADPGQSMPHNRYLVTSHFSLDLGRGMDFLNMLTHKNRDVTISILNGEELNSLLASYARYRTGASVSVT